MVSDLDTVGVQDVFRFGLDGIVSNFKKMDSGLRQHLIDSSKKVVVYGQISPRITEVLIIKVFTECK